MDRNTIIGLVLIVGIVLTWSIFFSPERDQKTEGQTTQTEQTQTPVQETPIEQPVQSPSRLGGIENGDFRPIGMDDSTYTSLSDSAKSAFKDAALEEEFGVFAPLALGEDKVIHISTDKLEFDLHTKGGIVRPMYLKDFQTSDSLPLPLISDAATNNMSLQFFHRSQRNDLLGTHTRDLYLEPNIADSKVELTGDQTKEIVFRGAIDSRHYFELVYTLKGNSYDYGFEVRMTGMNDLVKNSNYDLHWTAEIPKTEKAMSLQRAKTAVYYRESGDVESLSPQDPAPLKEDLSSTAVDWVAFKSQFFTQTLLSSEGEPFNNLTVSQANPIPPVIDDPNSGDVVKLMSMQAQMPISATGQYTKTFTVFNGPLEYTTLSDLERGMNRQIDLGWGPLKFINMYVIIPIFNFLEVAVGNYGIIILILALLIKLFLYPLTFKTYISTAKMRVINQTPEIKALEEKYKDDSTKLQQEKMGIYRQMGVSMLGGCLPMLLQYPFLISLFFLFPNLIELRQQSFLWAEDLSTYDSILELGFNIPFYGDHVSLFTLLMTVSIYVYTMINQKMQGTVQTNPVMKYFPYVMPLIFLGFLNNYSAGLSWYYLLSNLISITQAQVSKLFIDEEKLLNQMRANAKAKKKGTKGKSRMEKWAEKQQQKQKQVQSQRNNQRRGGGSKRK